MKAGDFGKKAVAVTNAMVNMAVLTIVLMLMAFAGYTLWDTKQIYHFADKAYYEVYKPAVENESKSFKELVKINPEVFAWLTVYGTKIDYPVVQGQNNMKYINTNAEGKYSLSGAIFLDYNNSKDFSDFNSILFGHHMEKQAMFGELGSFSAKEMFEAHRYGNLYYNDKQHGIEFFAFLHTDAYNSEVFKANAAENSWGSYLENLLDKAIHKRDIGITTEDRLILLATCSASSTNGRDILVGRITAEVFADPFKDPGSQDEKEGQKAGQGPRWLLGLAGILAGAAIGFASIIFINRGRKK